MHDLKSRIDDAYRRYESGESDAAIDMLFALHTDAHVKSDARFEVIDALSRLLTRSGRFDEAEAVLKDGLDQAKRQGKRRQLSHLWHLLGTTYAEADRYEDALGAFRSELHTASSHHEHYFARLSANYYAQGRLFLAQHDTEEAKRYFELALVFAATDGVALAEAEAHEGLARHALAIGDRSSALAHGKAALSAYTEAKAKREAAALRRLLPRTMTSDVDSEALSNAINSTFHPYRERPSHDDGLLRSPEEVT